MSVCERCTENHNCAWQNHEETICHERPAFPPTNADRIRAMSDEELAGWLYSLNDEHCDSICPPANPACLQQKNCMKCWLDWLKEESEGE